MFLDLQKSGWSQSMTFDGKRVEVVGRRPDNSNSSKMGSERVVSGPIGLVSTLQSSFHIEGIC